MSDDESMTDDLSSSSSDESGRELEEAAPADSTSNMNGEFSESGVVTLTDLSFLDCPICFESLLSPVYQCSNGHIACAQCCTKIANKCPSCRRRIGTIRCRVLETVIESVKLNCENKLYGCMEMFKHSKKLDKLNHEKICRYTPCTCPYNNCTYIGMSESLYKHFGEDHSPCVFSFNTMKSISLGASQTHVFLQDTARCTLFVLERTFKSPGSFVSVTCVGLPSMAFSYILIAVIDRNTSVSIKADVVCMQKWNAGCVLGKCLVLPSNMVNESGMLSLKLKIKRG